MKIYWRLKSVPELAVLLRSERQDAFVQAVQHRRSRVSTGQREGEFVGIVAAGGIAAAADGWR